MNIQHQISTPDSTPTFLEQHCWYFFHFIIMFVTSFCHCQCFFFFVSCLLLFNSYFSYPLFHIPPLFYSLFKKNIFFTSFNFHSFRVIYIIAFLPSNFAFLFSLLPPLLHLWYHNFVASILFPLSCFFHFYWHITLIPIWCHHF